jgi:hypothetical protein
LWRGDLAVVADVGNGPNLSVADRFATGGDEAAMVPSGGDHVTNKGDVAARDRDGTVDVELSCLVSGGLDGVVEGVDVIVGCRNQSYRATLVVIVDPTFSDQCQVVFEGAGDDAAVCLVRIQGAGVTDT